MPCTDAGHAVADRGAAGRLDADERGVGVDEPGEDPGRVRPAADARDDDVGVAAASSARHCARASSPMTRWNSRTIHGIRVRTHRPSRGSSASTRRWPPSRAWPR